MKQMLNFVIIGLVASMCLVPSESIQDDQKEGYSVCSTDVCKERAKLINESMNLPVDACYDFHSYVCGGWENQQEVPIYKGNFGIYDMLADKVKTTIQNILAGIVPSFTNQNITDKVGIIFNACMEFENTDDRPDGLVNVLKSYGLGDWPMLADTTTNATDMLLKTGIIGMFDLFVQRDPQNSTSHVIQISQPIMFTAPDDEYMKAMKQAAQLINPDVNETDFMEYIERVVAYARQIRNLELKGSHEKNQVGRATIGELQKNYSNIPLLQLLNKEFSKVNINLTENDVVELHPLNYYEAADKFLATFHPTTMFNYAGVRVISTFGEQASKNFRSAFPLHLANYPRGERSVVCADIIRNKLPAISSYLYEQRCFNASVKQEVGDIARRIKDSFSEMFQKSSWMDNTTKTALLEKLNKTIVRVGHREDVLNLGVLEELYKDIPYIPINATFVEMLHNITERGYRRNLKKLREPNEEREFSSSIGAFYDLQENAVVIPWGLLQHPIYQYGLPLSLNYGGIGGIIGHAISRAFDAKDITMSLAENLTRSEFHNRTQCFVTQYDSFPYFLFGMRAKYPINGTRTLAENVADTVGLQAAFNAYEKLLEEDCENADTRLPGLEVFTGKQLLLIGRAMEFCNTMNGLGLGLVAGYGRVSPPRHRINVPNKNLEEFAEVFNCSAGSPQIVTINKTCALW